MPEKRAQDLLRKHNISVEDVQERRTTLHHLRHIVHAEQLPFDVFKTLVKMRRCRAASNFRFWIWILDLGLAASKSGGRWEI